MKKELCIRCSAPMEKTFVDYRGVKLEARKCQKCGEKVFTEDLTKQAIAQLESLRIKGEYVKHPIKIGNSWGITFPKEVAQIFNLNSESELILRPQVDKNVLKIEIE